jgi:hypothetical protein
MDEVPGVYVQQIKYFVQPDGIIKAFTVFIEPQERMDSGGAHECLFV